MSSKKINKANKQDESEHVDYSTEDKDRDGLNNSETPSNFRRNCTKVKQLKPYLDLLPGNS